MREPIFQARATLLPAAQRPRLIPAWRPAISPIASSQVEPDLSIPSLGIFFASGPDEAQIGNTFSCAFQLLTWPDPACDPIAVGVEFAFLEGTTMVGMGKVVAVDHADGA